MNPAVLLLGAAGILLLTKGQDGMDAINPILPSWNAYDSLFKKYAAQNNLPPESWKWFKAIGIGESNLGSNPLVKARQWSSDGLSRGLMQVTTVTANDYEHWVPSVAVLKRDNPQEYERISSKLDDPETSIRIAAKHFARLYRKFGNTLEHAVKAYNQGEGNMAKEIALRASRGQPLKGFLIKEYPAAATYWSRFEKHLAQVEAKP